MKTKVTLSHSVCNKIQQKLAKVGSKPHFIHKLFKAEVFHSLKVIPIPLNLFPPQSYVREVGNNLMDLV